jgi:hypothetical protein
MSSTSERTPLPVKVALAALVIGGFLLCAGLIRAPWSDDVDCGGRSMKPGDRCVSSRGSSSTYEERMEVRENGTWLLIVGGIGVVGGLLTLVAMRRPGQD